MGKFIMLMSLLAIAILSVGTMLAPQSPAFWLAGSSAAVDNVRQILGLLLVAHLVTSPPRHLWLRFVSGTVAALIAVWTMQQTWNYHLELLDSLSFLAASLAIVIAALERKPLLQPVKKARRAAPQASRV
jgi:hypothetical protein